MIAAVLLSVTACSGKKESAAGDVRVQEQQQDMTAGPLNGTEVYDRSQMNGPTPGTQQDLVVNVGDRVFFDYDRFDVTSEGQNTLNMQAEWLKKYPNVHVTVEGHCDERGTREYNLALGEKRANSVKNYLIALGVDASRINTISYGKERPAVMGSNPSAWSQNRRGVTIVE
jgi:peptidoglycan-associated lipoprotein